MGEQIEQNLQAQKQPRNANFLNFSNICFFVDNDSASIALHQIIIKICFFQGETRREIPPFLSQGSQVSTHFLSQQRGTQQQGSTFLGTVCMGLGQGFGLGWGRRSGCAPCQPEQAIENPANPSVDSTAVSAALTIPVGVGAVASVVLPSAEDLNRYLAEQQRSLASPEWEEWPVVLQLLSTMCEKGFVVDEWFLR